MRFDIARRCHDRRAVSFHVDDDAAHTHRLPEAGNENAGSSARRVIATGNHGSDKPSGGRPTCFRRVTSAAQRLRDWRAETAIVLGSGLNSVVADNSEAIAYSEFPEIPSPRVAGHVGRFARGEKLIYAQGRVHLYEGHTADDVTAIIRVLAAAGIKRLILTNAAGSLNSSFAPASWMMISDHLNLTSTTPLLGRAQFIDMSGTYSSKWCAEFRSTSQQLSLRLHEGVYAGMLGPQYETPAEVRMLRS